MPPQAHEVRLKIIDGFDPGRASGLDDAGGERVAGERDPRPVVLVVPSAFQSPMSLELDTTVAGIRLEKSLYVHGPIVRRSSRGFTPILQGKRSGRTACFLRWAPGDIPPDEL